MRRPVIGAESLGGGPYHGKGLRCGGVVGHHLGEQLHKQLAAEEISRDDVAVEKRLIALCKQFGSARTRKPCAMASSRLPGRAMSGDTGYCQGDG